ncbi:SEC-C domain-containing protein [Mucilaginibacter angelicae]|uniref:SEC-C domain-containing protein n=1 Tax=Mucilaginibacter angelicae TaxID=869718 RepID=A0ABV6L010_9SPHI
MITVPAIESNQLAELCKLIGCDDTLVFVNLDLSENYPKNECFDNVSAKVIAHGGERVVGWSIWQHDYMLEAEYHAVWRSPEGQLVDITPKNLPFEHIMFIEAPTRPYQGVQLDNIRLNTTVNQLVDDFISLAETKFFIFSGGEKASQKFIRLTKNEQDILNYINGMMIAVDALLAKGGVRNSPCFCSSNLKYKHCHGKGLTSYLNSIKL